MQQPGYMNELNSDGLARWEAFVSSYLQKYNHGAWQAYLAVLAKSADREDQLVADGDPDLGAAITPVDWNGFPVRVRRCLQSDKMTYSFLDSTTASGDDGRFIGHEEYLEWRVVRDGAGKIVRAEYTTETLEYWEALAATDPARLLALCGEFAREPGPAAAGDVFGSLDPFGSGVTADQRAAAFVRQMAQSDSALPPSPYNNGKRAICFMGKGVNSLLAAVALAAYAARPYGKKVGAGGIALTGPEAIATGNQFAVDCRNSDPTIVGRLLSLAFDGRKLALADPVGIYMTDIERSGLRDQGGSPVPPGWFKQSRGRMAVVDGQEHSFFQRLVVEAPPGSSQVLGDLFDAGGDPIVSGAQLARLVTVGLYARASGTGAVGLDSAFPVLGQVKNCNLPSATDCAEFLASTDTLGAGPALGNTDTSGAKLTRNGK